MRIMRAIQQSQLTTAGVAAGRPQSGTTSRMRSAQPLMVRSFGPARGSGASTCNYLEAFELADGAVIHPSFQG